MGTALFSLILKRLWRTSGSINKLNMHWLSNRKADTLPALVGYVIFTQGTRVIRWNQWFITSTNLTAIFVTSDILIYISLTIDVKSATSNHLNEWRVGHIHGATPSVLEAVLVLSDCLIHCICGLLILYYNDTLVTYWHWLTTLWKTHPRSLDSRDYFKWLIYTTSLQ